jgi:2-hydroxy-3-keto-5-methylthiopentenyl-1-phosphate phosphatase
LRQCKQFIEWINHQGKIIFIISSGERGKYDTNVELEKLSSKDNIAHGRDITTSAAVSKIRVVLGKVTYLNIS